jgi:hypothetical protein
MREPGPARLAAAGPDGILARVIRGLAGHIVVPARHLRTGMAPAPQNPPLACRRSAMLRVRLLMGATSALDDGCLRTGAGDTSRAGGA